MTSSLWSRCVEELKYQLPDNIFIMWIKPLSAVEQDNALLINVPNQYFANYIEKNYLAQIQTVVDRLEPSREIAIQLQIDKAPTVTQSLNALEATEKAVPQGQSRGIQHLDPNFTFDQFVVGRNNQIAYSICKETASNLGESKNNPLFIYGSTGNL